jgi:adenylate kinase
MRLILLGPPGVGKGTQSKLLAQKLNIPHISTGDMLRESAASGSLLGKKAKALMDNGQLVPDEIMIGLIKQVLSSPKCKDGFILDGYPRTLAQAEALTKLMDELKISLDKVINIDLAHEEIVRRLSMRLVCKNCGRIYNIQHDMLADTTECMNCGGPLYQRDDDREDTVRERLKVYHRATAPVKQYYQQMGLLSEIDGGGDPEMINNEILSSLQPAN